MNWENGARPPNGTWCWVWDGVEVWLAMQDYLSDHGWTNEDTREDWTHGITHWIPLEKPTPPEA